MADAKIFEGSLPNMAEAKVLSVATSQSARDRVGDFVAGKYRIDALIGAGGMGRVYRALHLGLGEPVAVKFLGGAFAALQETRTRFQREAVALARLRHPSIVSVLDFGEEDGELFMVMELVGGATLQEAALGPVPMEIPRIHKVFDAILDVLEAAHVAGIVHRDLKLENVMLVPRKDGSDLVKVLDFGLAHVEVSGGSKLTETGIVRGTPHYMSPEQCRGEVVGPKGDVYSVAVMLYETIAGALPFQAGDAVQLMAQHLFVEPPSVATRGHKREVSPGLDALLLRALAKDAESRPTAHEMREQLRDAGLGLDPHARAQRDALDRARVGSLSREERALGQSEATGRGRLPGAGAGAGSAAETQAAPARVLVASTGADDEAARALVTALGVAGMRAWSAPFDGEKPPVDVGTANVLVLPDDDRVLGRLEAARKVAGASLPVLVVGVTSADRTAKLVRGNASDVAHTSLATAEIVRKIKRLAKRRV